MLADSATVPVLLGVTLFGPLPGACIFAAGEAIYLFREPSPRQPLSVLTNLVMCGWTCLAAGLFMNAVGFPAPVAESEPLLYLAVFVAGLVIVAIDTFVLSTVSVMYDDIDAQVLLRGILRTVIIPDVAMGAIAAVVLWTYFEFGIAGLVVPLVAVALLPRAVVHLFDRQPIDAMEVADATSHYATLLGGALGVSRHDRRVLTDAGAQMGGRPALNRSDDFQDVMQAVLYAGERWDGEPGGFPGTLSGDDIPLNSRVLAVAHLWASLTAKGTRQMQPRDALVELRARAGAELDPTVVAAAFKVVEDEFLPAPSGEPVAAGARH